MSYREYRMEKAFEFLKRNREVAFATVEGDRPKIRVFQIMKQEKETLYFVTAPGKEVTGSCGRIRMWRYLP